MTTTSTSRSQRRGDSGDPDRILGADWAVAVPRLLGLVDAGAILAALTLAQLLRFQGNSAVEGAGPLNYTALSLLLGAAWWLALWWTGAREIRNFGVGSDEYRRIARATFYLFGVLAIVSYLAEVQTARGYVALAVPIGLVFLLGARWLLRGAVARRRARGRFLRRILVVGSPDSVAHVTGQLLATPHAGYVPVAAVVPHGRDPADSRHSPAIDGSVPVIENGQSLDVLLAAIDEYDVGAVAIANDSGLSPTVTRDLGWKLQEREISLIMAPALTDVTGPRIHAQPVAGLPFIHVTTPKISGGHALLKRLFDLTCSAALLVALAPLLLVIAVGVLIGDGGPVFYSQQRIGHRGKPFTMLKFRSMLHGSERDFPSLTSDNASNPILFKMHDDPRVTSIGRYLRRTSLDELPQLFNVLRGDMSLVGPRPPLAHEVETYEHYVHRRFLVQPGMTGLWQVSGRADLSWEETVRLDLTYVENWSLTQDLLILAKTGRAVLSGKGAY
ncbi:sugar transferase [Kocuria soli]|uniref:Sugar transferase n=1 Tax=Kocuria soli TaxID=2485125 RepID=A0A3N3ZPT1_9MICC|nr:sugar transferase [Kocuria soli]ROZ63046.1 sugar transferase [Kocuria soli]